MKYNTTHAPTLLDILIDKERDSYVQLYSGPIGNSERDEDRFRCTDTTTGEDRIFQVRDWDILPFTGKRESLAIRVLTRPQQRHAYRLNEGTCITGVIVRRSHTEPRTK